MFRDRAFRLSRLALIATAFSVVLNLHAQEALPSARRTKSEETDRNPLSAFKDNGITFPITFTAEVFGNFAGGSSRTTIWESLLKAGIKVDFEKAAGLKGFSLRSDSAVVISES